MYQCHSHSLVSACLDLRVNEVCYNNIWCNNSATRSRSLVTQSVTWVSRFDSHWDPRYWKEGRNGSWPNNAAVLWKPFVLWVACLNHDTICSVKISESQQSWKSTYLYSHLPRYFKIIILLVRTVILCDIRLHKVLPSEIFRRMWNFPTWLHRLIKQTRSCLLLSAVWFRWSGILELHVWQYHLWYGTRVMIIRLNFERSF